LGIWHESDIGPDSPDMGKFHPKYELLKLHRRFVLLKKRKEEKCQKHDFH